MRAVAIQDFGGTDQLKLMDLSTSEPGPDDVLVRDRAGPWDAKTREGLFVERSFPRGWLRSAGERRIARLC